MQVRFWGVRGSYPCPDVSTIRYGGNTPCVEIRTDDGQLFVLDCGTGACQLGKQLTRESGESIEDGTLLLSHTHWDHIQGFPFFAPMFDANSKWSIYGPRGIGASLQHTLAGQLQYSYSPISLEKMAAEKRFVELNEGVFRIGEATIHTRFVNHPVLTLAYRIEADGATVVYVPDHEPHFEALADGIIELKSEDAAHADFVRNADLLIHDSHFFASEYADVKGWGHATMEYAVDLAILSDVKQLALFHLSPDRDDTEVDAMVQQAKSRVAEKGSSLSVVGSTEGMSIRCQGSRAETKQPSPSRTLHVDAPVNHQVVAVLQDQEIRESLAAATEANGFEFHAFENVEQLLESKSATSMSPSVIFVQAQTAGLCDLTPKLEQLALETPVVLVKEPGHSIACANQIQHFVSDWIGWPFSGPYGQARIAAWCIRAELRWLGARIPENEVERLAALNRLQILDTAREERFDRLTARAQEIAGTPVAAITLIDKNRQWFKSLQGGEMTETPRELAYCGYTILGDSLNIITDGREDPRFSGSPQVRDFGIRFYAGFPLKSPDDYNVGGFCVMDVRRRELTEEQLEKLQALAEEAQVELLRTPVSSS